MTSSWIFQTLFPIVLGLLLSNAITFSTFLIINRPICLFHSKFCCCFFLIFFFFFLFSAFSSLPGYLGVIFCSNYIYRRRTVPLHFTRNHSPYHFLLVCDPKIAKKCEYLNFFLLKLFSFPPRTYVASLISFSDAFPACTSPCCFTYLCALFFFL